MSNNLLNFWAPPAAPATPLGRHRKLAPSAGVHVSPICLGAMSIGTRWSEYGMGAMDKEASFRLLDAFYAAGGNFIDTANNYQEEESEEFLGEWMESRGIRDQIILATKYTTNYKLKKDIPQKTNYNGNSVKSMHLSVEASLKKLRTSYIDIFYVHWWDYNTTVEEVMNGLHTLVLSGKVLYLGISDTPAWVVSKANMYARQTGKTPFVIYQGAWNVLKRDFERDIIPMARDEGMALAPFDVLAGGKIRTDAEEQARMKSGEKGRTLWTDDWLRTPEQRKICLALEEVAKEIGAKSITAVAIAYVMQKTPYVFPVVGGRKVEHLMANIKAVNIALEPKHIKHIESVLPFEVGFPHDFIGTGTDNCFLFKSAGHFDRLPLQQPIKATDN
ncbi:aryl-alcohol dehydrogenase [Obba rivulosa]|uniref:Aryl-alcohol dehydrogenase n=1 Tax=Obba rivulosa TaxID=1052685 RepID=A0A8E2AQW0_9APHY|nr:aryl-alcohol dehydrogenase [Obba rivulosa]